MATCSLCTHVTFPHYVSMEQERERERLRERERAHSGLSSSSYKEQKNSIILGTHSLGLKASTYEFVWNIVPNQSIASCPWPPKIHALIAHKIYSSYSYSPKSLKSFQHQLENLKSKVSFKYHSKLGMGKTGGTIYFEAKFFSIYDLWNQTSYVLPKCNGGTGAE